MTHSATNFGALETLCHYSLDHFIETLQLICHTALRLPLCTHTDCIDSQPHTHSIYLSIQLSLSLPYSISLPLSISLTHSHEHSLVFSLSCSSSFPLSLTLTLSQTLSHTHTTPTHTQPHANIPNIQLAVHPPETHSAGMENMSIGQHIVPNC